MSSGPASSPVRTSTRARAGPVSGHRRLSATPGRRTRRSSAGFSAATDGRSTRCSRRCRGGCTSGACRSAWLDDLHPAGDARSRRADVPGAEHRAHPAGRADVHRGAAPIPRGACPPSRPAGSRVCATRWWDGRWRCCTPGPATPGLWPSWPRRSGSSRSNVSPSGSPIWSASRRCSTSPSGGCRWPPTCWPRAAPRWPRSRGEVGYDSEAAFSRAFKKATGTRAGSLARGPPHRITEFPPEQEVGTISHLRNRPSFAHFVTLNEARRDPVSKEAMCCSERSISHPSPASPAKSPSGPKTRSPPAPGRSGPRATSFPSPAACADGAEDVHRPAGASPGRVGARRRLRHRQPRHPRGTRRRPRHRHRHRPQPDRGGAARGPRRRARGRASRSATPRRCPTWTGSSTPR